MRDLNTSTPPLIFESVGIEWWTKLKSLLNYEVANREFGNELESVIMDGMLLVLILSALSTGVTWWVQRFFRAWQRVLIALVISMILSSLAHQHVFMKTQSSNS